MIHKFLKRFMLLSLMLISALVLNACDSEPPTLMKASKQFESDEIRDQHVAYMRKNHMNALKHKRDETMYQGIRTQKHSINACIDCHVPVTYQGKVLRHTDQEHFCTTCHTYVAAKLDCFECHVDHPVEMATAEHNLTTKTVQTFDHVNLNKFNAMNKEELIELAFKYSKENPSKSYAKSGGVYSKTVKDKNSSLNNPTELNTSNSAGNTNE